MQIQISSSSSMLSFSDADALICKHAHPPMPSETVNLESGQGRILAEPVLADRDLPPYPRSMMDGFAVRAEDLKNGQVEFPVTAKVFAGDPPIPSLNPGSCIQIMTGGVVPENAGYVIPVEDSEEVLPDRVRFHLPSKKIPSNIAPQGEDALKGREVLSAGEVLNALKIAVCASVGRVRIPVFCKPRIHVWATGSELVQPEETPKRHQIRDCNSKMIAAFCESLGFPCEKVGILPDESEILSKEIAKSLDADLLILSGGVSMGEKDLIPDILRSNGVRPVLHKVKIKPGKPLWFGQTDTCSVFGLPGNPVSTQVNLLLFVRSFLILKAGGMRREQTKIPVALAVENPSDKDWFLPGKIQNGEVQLLKMNSSGDFCNAARSDGFFRVPAHSMLKSGERGEFFSC